MKNLINTGTVKVDNLMMNKFDSVTDKKLLVSKKS